MPRRYIRRRRTGSAARQWQRQPRGSQHRDGRPPALSLRGLFRVRHSGDLLYFSPSIVCVMQSQAMFLLSAWWPPHCLWRWGMKKRFACCLTTAIAFGLTIAPIGTAQGQRGGATRWRSRPAADRLRVGNSRRRVLTILGPTPTRISSVADDANPVISPYKPTFTWCRMLEDGAHQEW